MRGENLRPFFGYYGGKWRAAPRYPAPAHSRIIEPFAGSAGYSVRHNARDVRLYDLSEKVIGTWQYLIKASASEVFALPDLEDGQTVDDLKVCQEARWLIGWWLAAGCWEPRKSPSAWMRKCTNGGLYWGPRVRSRISAQVESIRHWTASVGSYSDIPNEPATWFIDPPYQGMGKHYPHGSKGIDYEALGCWCRSRTGQAMVCENTGAEWLPFDHFMDAQAMGGARRGKVSREALWLGGVAQ